MFFQIKKEAARFRDDDNLGERMTALVEVRRPSSINPSSVSVVHSPPLPYRPSSMVHRPILSSDSVVRFCRPSREPSHWPKPIRKVNTGYICLPGYSSYVSLTAIMP